MGEYRRIRWGNIKGELINKKKTFWVANLHVPYVSLCEQHLIVYNKYKEITSDRTEAGETEKIQQQNEIIEQHQRMRSLMNNDGHF